MLQTHSIQNSPRTRSASLEIKTLFGVLKCEHEDIITFSNGLVGLPDLNSFVLADAPAKHLENLFLLQPVYDIEYSFVCCPILEENPFIDLQDILKIKKELQLSSGEYIMLLTCHFETVDPKIYIYVNPCAPIIIDKKTQRGGQYVFSSSKYPTRKLFKVLQKNRKLFFKTCNFLC